jgi:serine/threonine-protein kinase
VHRDLKPSNVMLCKIALAYDQVKVLDFGLVKRQPRAGVSVLTLDGVFGGTPGYVAPEVALGERQVDGRADLYALGCIAYFLLTSTVVFPELDPTASTLKHLQTPPDPPSRRTELPIPPALDQLVIECLEKSPDHRPANARELSRRLAAIETGTWSAADAEQWWRVNLPRPSREANAS